MLRETGQSEQVVALMKFLLFRVKTVCKPILDTSVAAHMLLPYTRHGPGQVLLARVYVRQIKRGKSN